MTSIQHIILSCTNRKRADASPTSRLRDLPRTDLVGRARTWIESLCSSPTVGTPSELYRGEYWREGLALAAVAGTRGRAELSVVSAGLGLVRGDAALPSYAATFTQRHPDSVVLAGGNASSDRRRWWDLLAQWAGPAGEGPRRLADLAATPGSSFIVCLGPDYLDAVAEDLRLAHKRVGDDRLAIVSSAPPIDGLSDVWVRCPGQLRMPLGGSMASTSVRAARMILESVDAGPVSATCARAVVQRALKKAAPLPQFERERLSDDQVIDWITDDARWHAESRNKSAALRRLRDSGRACEQGRFGELYDRAIDGKR